MTASQFQEVIRVINCMGWDDFETVFGDDFEHYLDKRNHLGIGKFICYLDLSNMRAMMKHVETKQEAFKQRQLKEA